MRPYPKILRTTVEADRDLRAYAAEYEIKPFEALVVAIDRLRDPVESDGLRASLAADLRSDLESAREATRRADAELAKLGALKSDEITPVIERFKEAFGADIPQAPSGRAAPQPCACALPTELDQRVRACIAARPNAVPPRDFAFVVKNGCDRIEGSDRYQDKIKAENAAKRAAREANDA